MLIFSDKTDQNIFHGVKINVPKSEISQINRVIVFSGFEKTF